MTMAEVLTTGAIKCKVPVKSSPSTIQNPASYRQDALPVAQPTASINVLQCLID